MNLIIKEKTTVMQKGTAMRWLELLDSAAKKEDYRYSKEQLGFDTDSFKYRCALGVLLESFGSEFAIGWDGVSYHYHNEFFKPSLDFLKRSKSKLSQDDWMALLSSFDSFKEAHAYIKQHYELM